MSHLPVPTGESAGIFIDPAPPSSVHILFVPPQFPFVVVESRLGGAVRYVKCRTLPGLLTVEVRTGECSEESRRTLSDGGRAQFGSFVSRHEIQWAFSLPLPFSPCEIGLLRDKHRSSVFNVFLRHGILSKPQAFTAKRVAQVRVNIDRDLYRVQ